MTITANDPVQASHVAIAEPAVPCAVPGGTEELVEEELLVEEISIDGMCGVY